MKRTNEASSRDTAHKLPKIVTTLPGPKAKEVLDMDTKYVSPSYTRSYPLVAESAAGSIVTDPDGNRFLDFNAGIAVCSTGHCHPEIVKTIQDQAAKLIHMSGTDFYYSAQTRLARKLAQLAPGESPKKVFFSNSGAEAVECAMKLARYKTGRTVMIAFIGAFHGRTMGALSLTASKALQRKGFAPLVPQVVHIPYAYCYRCEFGKDPKTCGTDCLRYLTETVFKKVVDPSDVAGIIMEPIQGEGGYVVPPRDFVQKLRAITREHGIMLIADEVQSGIGRTGKMFAIEHFDVQPDILCIAKGIASGMPLGCTVADASVMDWKPGMHASTFGGNPISCEAALKTLELLEAGVMENCRQMGARLKERLAGLVESSPHVGDVRGEGLMVGIEMVTDKQTRAPAPALRDRVVNRCFEKGVLILGCGPNTVRLSPPLIIERAQVDFAADVLEAAIRELN
ncbi:MAG: acetyl ornithine aminotransferase family protein [Candidatus Wallbacteria bacterium]|nr:acetyl ornithine aminotransferase family protein [Candidatus Wallbacteria bacterium]